MAELKLGFIDTRRKKRADKEVSIVQACSNHVEKQYSDSRNKALGYFKKASAEANELIRATESGSLPEDELADLEALLSLTEAQYATAQDNKRLFMNINIMLKQLLIYVETLIDLGDYKYVIKIIPEKDIPKYVKKSSVSELTEVAGIVAEIVDSVQTRLTQSFQGRMEVSDAIAKARAIGEKMREDRQLSSSGRRSIADIKAKYSDTTSRAAEYTVPNFTDASTAEQKRTNKA